MPFLRGLLWTLAGLAVLDALAHAAMLQFLGAFALAGFLVATGGGKE